jgi:hypothetical protein
MKIYGYTNDGSGQQDISPSDLTEITLVASPNELRAIAKFMEAAARGMEERGKNWEQEHLSDKYPEFKSSPQFVVSTPQA